MNILMYTLPEAKQRALHSHIMGHYIYSRFIPINPNYIDKYTLKTNLADKKKVHHLVTIPFIFVAWTPIYVQIGWLNPHISTSWL